MQDGPNILNKGRGDVQKARSPYVTFWLATVFLLTVMYAVWVWFAGGAWKVKTFQLSASGRNTCGAPMSEAGIKLFAALGPLFVLLWIWLMTRLDIPVQPLP
jgi:type IV secretory pathway VirB6-like protein